MYHNDDEACRILEKLKLKGGGRGFGMVVTKNCPKTIFCVQKEVFF